MKFEKDMDATWDTYQAFCKKFHRIGPKGDDEESARLFESWMAKGYDRKDPRGPQSVCVNIFTFRPRVSG